MSNSSINQYYNNVDQAVKFGKSRNEQSVRNFFWMLLNEYAQKLHYLVIPEVPVMGNLGKKVYPDETVKNNWGLDVGYWESKDEKTSLLGIPKTAWDYKLGNRSALEWILDQYKEKKPSDPTIAEKFNTYQFADYKEKVIDLLQRVCTVSVKTMEIIKEIGG